jgi:tetratricopeptide (TPR) repeat protein
MPHGAGVHQSMGLYYFATGQAELAVKCLEKAVEIDPSASNRGDLAHCVLKTGDLARGLKLIEARWESESILNKRPAWKLGLPIWNGQQVDTLLVSHEQGLGDTFQFIRFIPEIKARACARHVIFACPPSTHRLLNGQCGIDEIIDDGNPGDLAGAGMRAGADVRCCGSGIIL